MKKNTITKTTKIKETTKVNSLNKEQIIDYLNQFSIEKRMKLINKLKDLSKTNQDIYNYYFNGVKSIGKNNKNTYFKLIPLLVDVPRNGKSKETLLNEITFDGIKMLLDNLKIKETK